MSLFLTDNEMAELTGIKRGHHGISKAQLQCQYLREKGISFFQNIKGEPKVPRSQIDGSKQESSTTWQPSILQKTA